MTTSAPGSMALDLNSRNQLVSTAKGQQLSGVAAIMLELAAGVDLEPLNVDLGACAQCRCMEDCSQI